MRKLFCCRALGLALLVSLIGCEGQQFRAREAGALGGGALGAGLGAIIGSQTGHAGAGVAIGSAFGAITGGLIGNEIDRTDDQLKARQDQLAAQERELAENRRLLDELRARGADVHETRRGIVVNLPDVLFAFDSAEITSSARSATQDIAAAVKKTSGRSIAVEGHTDSVGTAEYNQRLSEARARSVANALTADGVSRKRLSVRGFGERDPIANNDSVSGRAKNRRVEVIIENR